jgi:polar amino acid transport system ATP-binding protein
MVFQRFNLFAHKTAMGNVMAGPMVVRGIARKDAERRAMELLDAVGVADRAGYYPHQLSGGQQQRVAIARALAMDPKVMLFDEPTSALDIELVGEVLEAMKRLARAGMTMIVVTHEVSFARDVADRVLMMDRGEIIEDAAPAVFFRTPRHDRTKAFLSKMTEA